MRVSYLVLFTVSRCAYGSGLRGGTGRRLQWKQVSGSVETPEDLAAPVAMLGWSLWITDRWLDLSKTHSEASLHREPFSNVDGGQFPPPAGRMLHYTTCGSIEWTCGGPSRGELSGGKWMVDRPREPRSRARSAAV